MSNFCFCPFCQNAASVRHDAPVLLRHYSGGLVSFQADRFYPDGGWMKPSGLWVSADDFGDGWADWCRDEDFNTGGITHMHRVVLKPEAKILWLWTLQDLCDLQSCLGIIDGTRDSTFLQRINWLRLQADNFDGVGIADYRKLAWDDTFVDLRFGRVCPRLDFGWVNSWDCSSACIWNLDAVQDVYLEEVIEEGEETDPILEVV